MADDNFNFWKRQASRQRFRRTPTQAVVAAQRVTVADNEDLRHKRMIGFSRAPCSGANDFIQHFPDGA